MSITASHMSRDMRCSVPSRVMPALFTRISIGPTSSVSCSHRKLAFIEVADVEFRDADAGLLVERRGGVVVPGVVGDDDAALLLQRHADGGADPSGSACHQCHTCHRFLPARCLDRAILTPAGETDSMRRDQDLLPHQASIR